MLLLLCYFFGVKTTEVFLSFGFFCFFLVLIILDGTTWIEYGALVYAAEWA